jgi:hypothetical protein
MIQGQSDDTTRVLWVSDVDIRYDQKEDLQKYCIGKLRIFYIKLISVHSWRDVIKAVSDNDCDIIALNIYSPEWLVNELKQNTHIPTLRAVASRVLSGDKVFDCSIGEFTDVYETVHLRFDKINF